MCFSKFHITKVCLVLLSVNCSNTLFAESAHERIAKNLFRTVEKGGCQDLVRNTFLGKAVASLEKTDAKTLKKLEEASGWFPIYFLKNSTVADTSLVKPTAYARQLFLESIVDTSNPRYAERLIEVQKFQSGISHLSIFSPRVRYSLISMVDKPEYFKVFSALGGLSKKDVLKMYANKASHVMSSVLEEIAELPQPKAGDVLYKIVRLLVERIDQVEPIGLIELNGSFHWDAFELTEILGFLEKENSTEFVSRIEKDFADLPTSYREFLAEPGIKYGLYHYYSAENVAILKKLVNSNWFRSEYQDVRGATFFYICKLHGLIENSSNKVHIQLLRNSIAHLVDGTIRIKVQEHEKSTHGATNGIGIIINSQIYFGTYHFFRNSVPDEIVGTLAHEMSHNLSGVPLKPTAEYFEEEMRAWLVGVFAESGKIPKKSQAAHHALYLIGNRHSYEQITAGFKTDPKSFEPYLNQLGLSLFDVQNHVNSNVAVNIEENGETAPLWGWPGFLTNSPRAP